jgi:hypothetical protein
MGSNVSSAASAMGGDGGLNNAPEADIANLSVPVLLPYLK